MPPTRSAPIPGSERDTQRRLKLYEVVLEWAERYRPFPPSCGYTAARHDPSPRSQEHSLEYYIAASTEQEAERQALNAFRKELKRSKGDLGYMLGKRMHRRGLFSQRPKKIVVSVQEVQVKCTEFSTGLEPVALGFARKKDRVLLRRRENYPFLRQPVTEENSGTPKEIAPSEASIPPVFDRWWAISFLRGISYLSRE